MSLLLLYKGLHIGFMVAWFAGIFYLPRLFVYHAGNQSADVDAIFKVMERRLLYFVTPFAVLTLLFGLLLIQGANLCFAFGQVAYRRLALGTVGSQQQHFGWFFVGATSVSLLATALFANWQRLPETKLEYGILLWLGLVASGLGYWPWNAGARQVSANQLAVMNNVLIPAGLLVNFVFWQHAVNWWTLSAGSALILLSLVYLATSALYCAARALAAAIDACASYSDDLARDSANGLTTLPMTLAIASNSLMDTP